MKFILSQEEYDDLVPIQKVIDRDKALAVARRLIVRLGNIDCGRSNCEICPICHMWLDDKKDCISRKNSKLICTLDRIYAK